MRITLLLKGSLQVMEQSCSIRFPSGNKRLLLTVQVREDDSNDLPRGTRITLHLKEDAKELADPTKLGSLIKQYSEFIQFPIKLWASKTEYDQVCDSLTFQTPANKQVQPERHSCGFVEP